MVKSKNMRSIAIFGICMMMIVSSCKSTASVSSSSNKSESTMSGAVQQGVNSGNVESGSQDGGKSGSKIANPTGLSPKNHSSPQTTPIKKTSSGVN